MEGRLVDVMTVRVLDGPLGGNSYELGGEPGEVIVLNSAAGVCNYQCTLVDDGELALIYLGPADPVQD